MKVRCTTCDELHDLSDLHVGYERPDAWYAVPPPEREARWVIGPDLAVLDGERFFLRGLVEIPVHGETHPYAWGAWARVDEADFRRYETRYDDPDRWLEPPFAGRLANQLPGYPQTLGLHVTIRLGRGGDRPSFTVDDGAHPLAVEQVQGVYVERVLEMLSPRLHGTNRRDPRGLPRFATLEAERWRLVEVEESWRGRDGGVLWFPEATARQEVPVGALAKLLWRIVASDTEGEAATHVERMWVEVDHREGTGESVLYSGTLMNDPFNPGLARWGTRAWFTPAHVADVCLDEDEPPLSDGADFRCHGHGASFPTCVCSHLCQGTDLGFHAVDDADTPRPDAWCDRCEEERLRAGGWNERSEAFAKVTLACGACYDIIEWNNRAQDGPSAV